MTLTMTVGSSPASLTAALSMQNVMALHEVVRMDSSLFELSKLPAVYVLLSEHA
jgi:hypothetical protein